MIEDLTEEELQELAREKDIADYQEAMHDLEEENTRIRQEQHEIDQTEMQHVLQQIHRMNIPQLKLVLEHIEHEVQLLLHYEVPK